MARANELCSLEIGYASLYIHRIHPSQSNTNDSVKQNCEQPSQAFAIYCSLSTPFTVSVHSKCESYSNFYRASALLAMQSAVLAREILSVRLSVCLSVRPSRSGIVSRRMKIQSCGFQHLVGQSL